MHRPSLLVVADQILPGLVLPWLQGVGQLNKLGLGQPLEQINLFQELHVHPALSHERPGHHVPVRLAVHRPALNLIRGGRDSSNSGRDVHQFQLSKHVSLLQVVLHDPVDGNRTFAFGDHVEEGLLQLLALVEDDVALPEVLAGHRLHCDEQLTVVEVREEHVVLENAVQGHNLVSRLGYHHMDVGLGLFVADDLAADRPAAALCRGLHREAGRRHLRVRAVHGLIIRSWARLLPKSEALRRKSCVGVGAVHGMYLLPRHGEVVVCVSRVERGAVALQNVHHRAHAQLKVRAVQLDKPDVALGTDIGHGAVVVNELQLPHAVPGGELTNLDGVVLLIPAEHLYHTLHNDMHR
eukprot:RCo020416